MDNIKIHSLLRRGSSHRNNCEDSLFHLKMNNIYCLGVFDGCSDGIDSYFASKLICNIFKQTISDHLLSNNTDTILSKNSLKEIYYQSLISLKKINEELNLETKALLSTVILSIVDISKNKSITMIIGDGCIITDSEFISIDQNNIPNYIGYYLNNNDILSLFDSEVVKIFENNFNNLFCISTDGILSFKNKDVNEIISFLIKDKSLIDSEASLSRKVNILENQNILHYDDLGIIRIIKDDKVI